MKGRTGRRDLQTFLADVYDRVQALERLVQGTPMIPFRTALAGPGSVASLINAGATEYRGHYISNDGGAFVYVHLYDKASAPIAGDPIVVTIGIPFESGANQEYSEGVETFDSGLAMAISSSPSTIASVPSGTVVATIYYSEA